MVSLFSYNLKDVPPDKKWINLNHPLSAEVRALTYGCFWFYLFITKSSPARLPRQVERRDTI